MSERFRKWLDGGFEVYDLMPDAAEGYDVPIEKVEQKRQEINRQIDEDEKTKNFIRSTDKGFRKLYNIVAVISCVMLIGVLLYTVGNLPYYGKENPRASKVYTRYIEKGVEETGAINAVAGMILDYRAFDTLGESHVLFTALLCVMVLLGRDRKNMRRDYEDYYKIANDRYHDLYRDPILYRVGTVLIPAIFLFGMYVLLNGQNSPGGGFSGGAIMGAGLILMSAVFGFDRVDGFFTRRLFSWLSLVALAFYSFAKGYVFFMGANGLENHIPKGWPGTILSGGLILPLDIAVGLVVCCTMFGFYSLYRRGSIGGK